MVSNKIGVIGKLQILWLPAATSVSAVRAAVFRLMASLMDKGADQQGLLFLVDPKIQEQRLDEEWKLLERTFRPEIMRNVVLGRMRGEQVTFSSGGFQPDRQIVAQLRQMYHLGKMNPPTPLRRPDLFHEILKLLIHAWLTRIGPVTTRWICEAAGCSYPSAINVLKRLSPMLRHESDRRLELSMFPRDDWAFLVATAERARATMKFSDPSGKPRTAEQILKRVRELGQGAIAVGGVHGAKHHFPDLDLVGASRVDLVVHCPKREVKLDFVSRLDAALEHSDNSREPPFLVLHFLRRKENFYLQGDDGQRWADMVECLLDLHEARHEPQAVQYLNHFLFKRKDIIHARCTGT